MRVAGVCFLRARLVERFTAGLRAVLDPALAFVAFLALAPDAFFRARFGRGEALDRADDLPRDFLPDDFDAVAMFRSSGWVRSRISQDSRTAIASGW